jgi:hypothetical protein
MDITLLALKLGAMASDLTHRSSNHTQSYTIPFPKSGTNRVRTRHLIPCIQMKYIVGQSLKPKAKRKRKKKLYSTTLFKG